MELKINEQSVNTVQIEGKEVKVVSVEEAQNLIQQANAELTKAVEEATKNTKTQFSRDLSKKIGVNLFDDAEIDKFTESLKTKVDASVVEDYKAQLESLKDIDKKYKDLQFDNALLENNIKKDYSPKVRKLVDVEMSLNEELDFNKAIEQVVNDFPMFKEGKRKGGMDLGGGDGQTEYEAHVAKKYKNNPYYNGQ